MLDRVSCRMSAKAIKRNEARREVLVWNYGHWLLSVCGMSMLSRCGWSNQYHSDNDDDNDSNFPLFVDRKANGIDLLGGTALGTAGRHCSCIACTWLRLLPLLLQNAQAATCRTVALISVRPDEASTSLSEFHHPRRSTTRLQWITLGKFSHQLYFTIKKSVVMLQ